MPHIRPKSRLGFVLRIARGALPLMLLALAACENAKPRSATPSPRVGTSRPASPELPLVSPLALPRADEAAFNRVWRAGLAELNHYALTQARYGELHGGDAVLIFVTEDFLPGAQVKSERPRPPADVVPILKLNLHKTFTTGLYPYSMMSSVFSPLAPPNALSLPAALKVTTSSQEWCGHTFLQLNRLASGRVRARGYSYFEAEGDQDREIEGALLEDELWTRIRIAPHTLPVGKFSLIPGTMTSRLRHRVIEPRDAHAALRRADPATVRYELRYPSEHRALAIDFRDAPPFELVGWTETYPDGFGANPRMLTTTARRTHVLRDAYWTHNRLGDRALREKLGLRAE